MLMKRTQQRTSSVGTSVGALGRPPGAKPGFLARKECKESHRKICGQVIYVPIVEAPGQTGIGRFGSLFITRTSRLPTEQRSSLVALW